MKFAATAAVALAATISLLQLTEAKKTRNGFNFGANRGDGSCKSEADWHRDFKGMKKVPGRFHQARLYASSDCGQLAAAVPAAKKAGIKILAGVWTEDSAHYAAEKAALMSAIQNHGIGWLSSVAVGSEDLYRGDTTAAALAGQVKEVRGMLAGVKGGKHIPVGHVDTWTAWVKDSSAVLIKAVDFLGMDGYPYFQGAKIGNAHKVFYKSLHRTQAAMKRHTKHDKPVWVTETGWPISGPNYGKSHPSRANARRYWKGTMCHLFKTHNVFAYTLRDSNANKGDPNFSVVDKHFKPTYNLRC